MKVLIPKCILELHRNDFEWLCNSIEKGLYSIDIERLILVIKKRCFTFQDVNEEIDIDDCKFNILLTCKEELSKIEKKFRLKKEEMSLLISYLAIYGFTMGDI